MPLSSLEECSRFKLIGNDAASLLRRGFRHRAEGNCSLAAAVGQLLTASPLLVHYDMMGLSPKASLALRNAFCRGMEIWSAATEGRFVLREQGNHAHNLRVSLFDEESHDSPPGIASSRYGRRVIPARSRTIVLQIDAGIRLSRQFVEANWQDHEHMLALCLHEMGHVAGLGDGPPDGVMAAALSARPEWPSEDEVQAISLIYGACAHLEGRRLADTGLSAAGGVWPCRGFEVETAEAAASTCIKKEAA